MTGGEPLTEMAGQEAKPRFGQHAAANIGLFVASCVVVALVEAGLNVTTNGPGQGNDPTTVTIVEGLYGALYYALFGILPAIAVLLLVPRVLARSSPVVRRVAVVVVATVVGVGFWIAIWQVGSGFTAATYLHGYVWLALLGGPVWVGFGLLLRLPRPTAAG